MLGGRAPVRALVTSDPGYARNARADASWRSRWDSSADTRCPSETRRNASRAGRGCVRAAARALLRARRLAARVLVFSSSADARVIDTSLDADVGLTRGVGFGSNAKALGKRTKFVRELVREVTGLAPYEKRICELLKVGKDKRALKVAKKKVSLSMEREKMGRRRKRENRCRSKDTFDLVTRGEEIKS